jgi:hypothetical protein
MYNIYRPRSVQALQSRLCLPREETEQSMLLSFIWAQVTLNIGREPNKGNGDAIT